MAGGNLLNSGPLARMFDPQTYADKQATDIARYSGDPNMFPVMKSALWASEGYPHWLIRFLMDNNGYTQGLTDKGIGIGDGRQRDVEDFYQRAGGKASGGLARMKECSCHG